MRIDVACWYHWNEYLDIDACLCHQKKKVKLKNLFPFFIIRGTISRSKEWHKRSPHEILKHLVRCNLLSPRSLHTFFNQFLWLIFFYVEKLKLSSRAVKVMFLWLFFQGARKYRYVIIFLSRLSSRNCSWRKETFSLKKIIFLHVARLLINKLSNKRFLQEKRKLWWNFRKNDEVIRRIYDV